jgi:hypothetical protein
MFSWVMLLLVRTRARNGIRKAENIMEQHGLHAANANRPDASIHPRRACAASVDR